MSTNNQATPPPPAPVPPEGYRLLTDEEKAKLLPLDVIYLSRNGWKISQHRGHFVPEYYQKATQYATREPLSDRLGSATWDDIEHSPAEPSGEDGPWAEGWNERSASESSGDVHLANALAEIERLKAQLAEGRRQGREEALAILIRESAETFDKFMCSQSLGESGDYATVWDNEKLEKLFEVKSSTSLVERTEAAYWGKLLEIENLKQELAAAHTLAQEGEALAVLESIPKEFAVRIREGGADENIYASLAVSVAKMSKALATPSPAPVAGKTNPPEISSPLVDGGEKASAGPTINYDAHPETDAFMTHIDDSSIDLDQVAAQMGGFEAERNFARQAIQIMLASARPHPTENPTMFEAWKRGKAALTPPVAEGNKGKKCTCSVGPVAKFGGASSYIQNPTCPVHSAPPTLTQLVRAEEAL